MVISKLVTYALRTGLISQDVVFARTAEGKAAFLRFLATM